MARILQEANKTMEEMEKLKLADFKRKDKNARLKDELKNTKILLQESVTVRTLKDSLEHDLQSKLNQNQVAMGAMKNELTLEKKNVASLKENISNLRTNTEKYKDDTNSEVEVLKLEAREKLDKISQQHLQIQRLLHEMENEKANNVKLKEDLSNHKLSVGTLEKELTKARTKNFQRESELDNLSLELQESRNKVNSLEDQLSTQNIKEKTMQSTIMHLTNRIKNHKNDAEKFVLESGSIAGKLNNREIEIQTQSKQIQEQSKTITELRGRMLSKQIQEQSKTMTELRGRVSGSKSFDFEREELQLKIMAVQNELSNSNAKIAEQEFQQERSTVSYKKEDDNNSFSKLQSFRETMVDHDTTRALRSKVSQHISNLDELRSQQPKNYEKVGIRGDDDLVIGDIFRYGIEEQQHNTPLEKDETTSRPHGETENTLTRNIYNSNSGNLKMYENLAASKEEHTALYRSKGPYSLIGIEEQLQIRQTKSAQSNYSDENAEKGQNDNSSSLTNTNFSYLNTGSTAENTIQMGNRDMEAPFKISDWEKYGESAADNAESNEHVKHSEKKSSDNLTDPSNTDYHTDPEFEAKLRRILGRR